MTSIFQEHVLHNAREDLSQSDLFKNEDSIDPKEKEFVQHLSNKSSAELTLKELEKLKHIARKSISASVRVQIWLLLSGGADVTYQALYEDTCQELFPDDDFIPDGEEDGSRAFLTYYLSEDGGKKLRKLLCVLKHLNPDITYCPLLEPIVSILLHFMDAESAFACASGLVSGKFASPFLDQTKIENITTDATLQDLFRSVHKKGYNRVNSFLDFKLETGIEKEVLFPSWRMVLFENLDFVSLIRILDCLMVEGVKILYRVGIYLLQSFHEYSLTFQKLHCQTPSDLAATVGQYAMSLKIPVEDLLKAAMKINITTKQMVKAKQENTKLYKANKLGWSEVVDMKQVVAVDLRQVSDIIKPNQWQTLSEWLPPRMQIQVPMLLFSTNKDGYNLKTLYLMCEDEEQTLIIIHTSTDEIFGAYLSTSLTHRHDGRNNMSYFGTGETFLFKLSPNCVVYHWNERSEKKKQVNRKRSTYVFVDTKQINLEDADNPKTKHQTKKNRKISMKRTLSRKLSNAKPSFNRSSSHSAYTKRDMLSVSLHPLNAINKVRSNYSVPKYLYLGGDKPDGFEKLISQETVHESKKKPRLASAQTFDLGDMKKLQKVANFEIVDEDDGLKDIVKPRSQTQGGAKLKSQKMNIDSDQFDVIQEESVPPTIGSLALPDTRLKNNQDIGGKRIELFISCDNNRLAVGGGESGYGLWIDGELSKGQTVKCDTFHNNPLSDGENGDFTIMRIDVFGFQ